MTPCPYRNKKCYSCRCYKSYNTGGYLYCQCGYEPTEYNKGLTKYGEL